MTSIKLENGDDVVLYSSVKEFPVRLAKEFQKYLLQDAGIGDSMADVDEHLHRLMVQVQKQDLESIGTEVHNLRFNMFSMLDGWNFKSLAFGCLVKEVAGVPVKDYSSDSIKKLIDDLSDRGLTMQAVVDVVDDVKKNAIPNSNYISRSSLLKT